MRSVDLVKSMSLSPSMAAITCGGGASRGCHAEGDAAAAAAAASSSSYPERTAGCWSGVRFVKTFSTEPS